MRPMLPTMPLNMSQTLCTIIHTMPQLNGQPVHYPAPDLPRQTQNDPSTQIHVPQQHFHVPHQVTDLVHQPPSVNQPKTKTNFKLIKGIDFLKAEHRETLQDYAELSKAHRKLSKEYKDLQAKHSKVCSDMKLNWQIF